MAVTSIWRVHRSVGKVLNYVENEEKTTCVSNDLYQGADDLSSVSTGWGRDTRWMKFWTVSMIMCADRLHSRKQTDWRHGATPLSRIQKRKESTPCIFAIAMNCTSSKSIRHP